MGSKPSPIVHDPPPRSVSVLLVGLVRVVRANGLGTSHLEIVVVRGERGSSFVGADEASGPEEEVEGEGELREGGVSSAPAGRRGSGAGTSRGIGNR